MNANAKMNTSSHHHHTRPVRNPRLPSALRTPLPPHPSPRLPPHTSLHSLPHPSPHLPPAFSSRRCFALRCFALRCLARLRLACRRLSLLPTVLLAPLLAPLLAAEPFDYALDPGLAGTQVSITESPVTLGSLLDLCERQTRFRFVYEKSSAPLDAPVELPVASGQRLSTVLAVASAQAEVVFKRQNNQIALRLRHDDDQVAPPPSTGAGASQNTAAATATGVVTMERYRVTSTLLRANTRDMFTEMRRGSAISIETLSAEDMARFVGSDVSDLMIRIPGVSVSVTGNFAVVRGLSERYNTVTLNGLVLPSSDPERQSTELDQFPSRLLDGIVVYKNFSPELPGNLSGGGVEMKPLSFPTRRILSLTLGASFDESVFSGANDFLTYRTSGHNDLWALGSRDRISTGEAFNLPVTPGTGGSTRIAPDADTPFTVRRKHMPAGPKFGLVYGDTFRLGSDARLGVSAGLSYDSSYGTETGSTHGPDFAGNKTAGHGATLNDYPNNGGYDYTRSKAEVSLGLLANATFSWNQWNRVGFTGFLSRTGIDLAQHDDDMVYLQGTTLTPHAANYTQTSIETTAWRFRDRIDYRERELGVLALAGEHLFPAARDGALSWAAALANASQDQPDSRRITYTQPYGKDYYEIPMGTEQDGLINRQWRKIDEDQRSLQFSWKQPLGRDSALTLGATVTTTDRIYRERLGTADVDGLADPPRYRPFDAPSDIWEYAITRLRISSTIDQDRTIAALFLKGETPLVSRRLRLSGGLRFERTKLGASGFGQMPGTDGSSSILHYMNGDNLRYGYFPQMNDLNVNDYAAGEARATPHIDQVDFLPMAGLTWNPIDPLTFRLSASKTIARPSMREVGNYYSWNFDTERYQHGNGFLEISGVRNLDFRAEYFFGQGDLVALSLFRKLIKKPIEMGTVTMPRVNGAKAETWFNNDHTARLTGVEFEFRKNLGFLGDALSGLSLGGNAAWIDASVDNITFATKSHLGKAYKRQLYDQPRWLANLDATWEIRRWGSTLTLAWFATDRVLSAVEDDFDQYLDSHDRFDLSYTQRLGKRLALKLSVKNLSDPERRYIRDKDQTGGITIVDRRWHEGRSFTATLSAEF